MRKSVRIVVVLAVSFATCVLTLFLFFLGPQVVYHLRSPSFSSECSSIHAGMSREQVLRLIHMRTPPPEEGLFHLRTAHPDEGFSSTEGLYFSRGTPVTSVCTVTFDPQSGTVVGTPETSVGW